MSFALRKALAALGFAAAIVYGLVLCAVRRDRGRVARDVGRVMARLMRPPLRLDVRVAGEETLRRSEPCVYIANHQSVLDIPILAGIFPERTALVAKAELRRVPLLARLFTASGNVFVERGDREQGAAVLRWLDRQIREHGRSAWFFPEGTYARDRTRLLPFKHGAFRLAVATGAPIVPVVVSRLAPAFDLGAHRLGPGIVTVRVLEPIPARGLTPDDVPALAERARDVVAATLRDAARHCPARLPPA